MSPSIWISCAGPNSVGPLTLVAWRIVEAQHRVSTRPLVDTLEDQALLEDILEEAKPPAPAGPPWKGLHFLLWTPFRYPPLRNGSRFGGRHERSLWYGATAPETALAEKAYYLLVFANGSVAKLRMRTDWTLFSVAVGTTHGIDLTKPPFAAFAPVLASPTSYEQPQRLGTEMRAAGVDAFTFRSARTRDGINVGLFEPAFAEKQPHEQQTWRSDVTRQSCEFVALNQRSPPAFAFARSLYEVDGRLPSPAL